MPDEHPSIPRCQSCGIPIGVGFYGTKADGSENQEYCKFCYQNGAFTEPDLNMDGMIKKSVAYMMDQLNFSEERAEVISNALIPTLKRWRG